MPEMWRSIPGFTGYEASNNGRIRSLDRVVAMTNGRSRKHHGRLRKPFQNPVNGYWVIGGLPNGRTRPVHILVCLAFHGPRPAADSVVRHLNGDSEDNRPENLAWGTYSQNNFDLVRHGTHWRAALTHCIRGHAFDDENTYWRREGGRACKTCTRQRHMKQKGTV